MRVDLGVLIGCRIVEGVEANGRCRLYNSKPSLSVKEEKDGILEKTF